MTSIQTSEHSPGAATGTDAVLFGKQTELGVQNFGSGRRAVADVPSLIRHYARVKQAAARANLRVGALDPVRAQAIETACDEVASGAHTTQFPTALVLGGGGTTTNMNVNEVLASRASQLAGVPVHPNDHVNASQSTNDSYPSAMALTIHELSQSPVDALLRLVESFEQKAKEFDEVTRLGRTCLQDAVSLTVGQTHRSHATAVRRVAWQLQEACVPLLAVPLGATVLGTGIGAPEGYRAAAIEELARLTGLPVSASEDMFDSLAHLDPYAAIASAGSRAAISMAKIAADLRLLSSGPGGGFAEVTLPAVQAGSSIMPGKINPVIPEYVMQLSYRIRGAAHTVESAVAAGELELNIMEPIIVDSLIDIFEDLQSSATTFATLCVDGLIWDGARLAANSSAGFDEWVELAAREGYDEATSQIKARREQAGAGR